MCADMKTIFFIVFFLILITPTLAQTLGEPIVNPFNITETKDSIITTYDYNTMTVCNGKQCVATIGLNYAFDVDRKWKLIDEAYSLKNSSVGCVVNSDKVHLAECLDWNLTYITVDMNMDSKDSKELENVPITVYTPNETKNDSEKTGDYKKDYLIKSSVNLSFASKNDVKTQTITFSLGDILEFGSNSTTITLNESNSGNVGDTETTSGGTSINYGTRAYLLAGSSTGTVWISFIMWNMSLIPAGNTITNANMSLYYYNGYVSGNYYQAYNTTPMNTTGTSYWNEGTLQDSCGSGVDCNRDHNMTYANMPAMGTMQVNITNTTAVPLNIYFNVTEAAKTAYANTTYSRLSIAIKGTGTELSAGQFCSKENATVSCRPQLVITYTAGGDSTPPTFTNPSINTTCAGKPVNVSIVIQDETGLSGYIFSTNNTGTWLNTTWSSLTNGTVASNITTLNSTSGTVVNYTWYANDTSNNWATRLNSTTTTDCNPPTYNVNGTNNTNPAPLSQVLYYANWSDNVALSGYIFSWNATGATCAGGMTNDTWVSMTGVTNWSNVTKQSPLACAGKVIDFLFYANDTSNNWNKTTDITEAEIGDTCTYSSGDWSIDCKDKCNITNTNITGILRVYSTGAGYVNTTNITASSMIENYTDACYVIRNLRI